MQSLSVKFALSYLTFLVLIAVFANVLANSDYGILVKYSPNSIGKKSNLFKAPGFMDTYEGIDRIHPLGTDGRGRDVASSLIHGSRTSLLLGFFASLMSLLLGTTLGLASAYYGNRTLRIHPLQLFLLIIGFLLLAFYAYEYSWICKQEQLSFSYTRLLSLFLIGSGLLIFSSKMFSRILSPLIFIPLDSIVMRFTEIFRAIPKLFLLLALITFFRSQGVWPTILLLGVLGWPRIMRLVRGEVLEIKEQTYIINARVMGLSDLRIMLRHILPNVLPILLISMAFLISGNILLESTLSFLGLGLPLDLPSWGGILRQSRENFGAWWLAVIPGLNITFTLFSLNIIAEYYNNRSKKAI